MIVAAAVLCTTFLAMLVYLTVLVADIKSTIDDRMNEALGALLHIKGERVAAEALVPAKPRRPAYGDDAHEAPGYMQPRQIGLNSR